MNKIILIIMLTCITLGCLVGNSLAIFKSTKFTILVVDEEGKPLSGINIGVGFERNITWGTKSSGQQGVTDADGRLTFSGESNGHITYGGRMDGYYPSYYDYDFKELGEFGWKPWNPELKIVMRKIENPVPMYARDVKKSKKKIELPILGQEVGFDLEAYDWVPPYGSGKNIDFIFEAKKSVIDKKNYDVSVKLSFSNKWDGIIKIKDEFNNGSEFKLPRIAPETGYFEIINFEEYRRSGQNIDRNFDPENSYIFKVRSKYIEGKFVEAKYGKIHGPIIIDPAWSETVRIYFRYFFNPDGSRNLEFDPSRNLFKNLSPMERVGIK